MKISSLRTKRWISTVLLKMSYSSFLFNDVETTKDWTVEAPKTGKV